MIMFTMMLIMLYVLIGFYVVYYAHKSGFFDGETDAMTGLLSIMIVLMWPVIAIYELVAAFGRLVRRF